jgi:hypothetical protein
VAEEEKKEKEVMEMTDGLNIFFIAIGVSALIYFLYNGENICAWLKNKWGN